jgi:hypothetical protein
MQPAAGTDYVTGSALTAAQVTSLIRDSEAVTITAGLETVDLSLNMQRDITTEFAGGSVSRSNYATLHGSATLNVSTELDWGTALVRPYMVITDDIITRRFNLGAYLTSSPRMQAGDVPVTHEITAYDILHWLNTPVGEAFTLEAGTGYLAAIESIMLAQGITSYFIDQTQTAQVLPAARSWVFDDHTTWLNIINDLCASVGYQGIWSDWDGRMQVRPYLLPRDRSIEWVYDDKPTTSMIAPGRAIIRDWFDVPNRWVFFWSKDPENAAPVEGTGIYTYVNQYDGPTSVQARGRTISAKPQQIDAVDQAALVDKAQQSIDADMRLKTTYELSTFPNPLSWHFDRLTIIDSGLGPIADVLAVKWTLPLDGSNMSHEWSLL